MPPNGGPAVRGWCSGEQELRIDLLDNDGNPSGPPIVVSMVLQLIPLGALVLGMAIATTDDERVSPDRRVVPLSWVARMPRLTLSVDPLSDMGLDALGHFAQVATQAVSQRIPMEPTPAGNRPAPLGTA